MKYLISLAVIATFNLCPVTFKVYFPGGKACEITLPIEDYKRMAPDEPTMRDWIRDATRDVVSSELMALMHIMSGEVPSFPTEIEDDKEITLTIVKSRDIVGQRITPSVSFCYFEFSDVGPDCRMLLRGKIIRPDELKFVRRGKCEFCKQYLTDMMRKEEIYLIELDIRGNKINFGSFRAVFRMEGDSLLSSLEKLLKWHDPYDKYVYQSARVFVFYKFLSKLGGKFYTSISTSPIPIPISISNSPITNPIEVTDQHFMEYPEISCMESQIAEYTVAIEKAMESSDQEPSVTLACGTDSTEITPPTAQGSTEALVITGTP